MTRQEIAKRSLKKKLNKREKQFEKLWEGIVTDVNNYTEKHGTLSDYHIAEGFVDNLCLSGAWIADRLTGHSGVPSLERYKGSLTKKIRKALGYTL